MLDSKHNNPPDPIDEVIALHSDTIAEAENWLDGEPVADEGQLKAVDVLTKAVKAALKDANAAEKSAAAPLHDAWKAEKARWKPTLDDLARIRDGLVALAAPFKAKLAEEKRAAERAAWEAAEKARKDAEAMAAQANAADIEAQREAAAAAQAAIEAQQAASAASKDKVGGMRKVAKFEVTDMRALINWIAVNDKPAIAEFATEYARKNHKVAPLDGVDSWTEKEAF